MENIHTDLGRKGLSFKAITKTPKKIRGHQPQELELIRA